MAAMHPSEPPARWSLVVPLKPLARAKTRLTPAARGGRMPALVLAFAKDTVSAALRCRLVASVVVVTDDAYASAELAALGARPVPDAPAAGLNAALAYGAAAARAAAPAAPVAALNADLPALRTAELARALTAAGQFPRAFLADAEKKGTTLLSALPGMELAPAFGVESRTAHGASGAVELTLGGVESVRRDVDTAADLEAAAELGLGPWTDAWRAAGAGPAARPAAR
ncbi:2-phospho-L-lactate guanylyltransferase [Streptomyces sulphureus]|uniref:2-phospho-L-lactate guanylyltransferase n=1 Tax=Streptomyces sulphureus TaxID=47758 RepID=UPI00038122BD|nr:2-phospho-L-lactate guanylyltransferase [Streptomyces sulphureus]